MAIRDSSKKPFIVDRDNDIFIGIDLPFRKSNASEGWFASTNTTLKAVKNNIKLLLQTHKGERLMQPNLGLNLRKYLFEQYTVDTVSSIESDIVDTFEYWLPFVNITELDINMDGSDAIGKNQLNIFIKFNINRDPNASESVQITLGE